MSRPSITANCICSNSLIGSCSITDEDVDDDDDSIDFSGAPHCFESTAAVALVVVVVSEWKWMDLGFDAAAEATNLS